MTLGQKIRVLRKSKELSMYELAKMSGVNRSVIRDIEMGGYKVAHETVQKIAKALRVPMCEFEKYSGSFRDTAVKLEQPNREICEGCSHWRHFYESYNACHYCIDNDHGLSGFDPKTGKCSTFEPKKRGQEFVSAFTINNK